MSGNTDAHTLTSISSNASINSSQVMHHSTTGAANNRIPPKQQQQPQQQPTNAVHPQHLKQPSNNDEISAHSSNTNTWKNNPRKKKRPVVQRNPSYNFNSTGSNPKYIYSVDDDIDEIGKDLEREYLEGYNDALRYRYKKSSKNLRLDNAKSSGVSSPELHHLSHDVLNNLINAEASLKKLEQKESDFHTRPLQLSQPILPDEDHISTHHLSPEVEDEDAQIEEEEHDNEQDGEEQDDDSQSVHSLESFTLRERQDAINTTHPFGIRIWKPALYKKIRSVQREADQDIHETDSFNKKKISWSVFLTNILWSLTFGLLFFILCFIGSVLLLIFGFNTVTYAKVFFNLGIYLLWPFGKIIYLQKDENYLSEDSNEGTTIGEYQRWRDEEQNKLFFSPSNSASAGLSSQRNVAGSSLENSNNAQTQPNLATNEAQDSDPEESDHRKKRLFGRGDWNLSRILFYLYFYLVLQPVLVIIWLCCWLCVFTIPMAKLIATLSDHLRRHPLAVFFKFDSRQSLPSDKPRNANILLCTYRCSGWHYYKYTVEGTNIFFINLLFIVFFTIIDFFIIKDFFKVDLLLTNDSVIFALCLLSIIPLAYFIGQAVASISAQSSMGLSAVINAFFSTVVEVYLYCIALNQKKGRLVEGSMIGSILGAVLLLPGLSMCAGAFIRKTQRYNPASAGVSSTMLLFSIAVMFVPTVFQQIYGRYEIKCSPCVNVIVSALDETCKRCHFIQPPLQMDELYRKVLMPFSVICAIILFTAYIVGLWFTLRTHAALIWQTPISESARPKPVPSVSSETVDQITEAHPVQQHQVQIQSQPHQHGESSGGGHEAPNWSKAKSTCVLLGATLLYAIIAEILVDCVDAVLKNFPIDPKFMGITIFALVPNTTEFLNAISFATYGNVALSMEIGTAYALQVCLIQIPSLVLYSIFFINWDDSSLQIKDSMFTLIFPKWDLFASVMSVVLFTYIYAEGKSNYFKGSILILLYITVVIGFYFTGDIETSDLFNISGFFVNS